MRKASVLALVALIGVGSAVAQDRPLVCFGNEPSWSVALVEPGAARLAFPDAPATAYRGSETRLAHLGEWVWRGKPVAGNGGDLVAFLRESACSDGMSDAKHPVVARVSLADGRFFAGCCRLASARGEGPAVAPQSIDGATWRLTQLPGKDASALASSSRPLTVRFEGGRISGFSGCNRFVGGYALDRDRVTIGPLAGSMMACGEQATALEKAVLGGLAGTHRFAVAGGSLTLTAESGAVLGLRAEPPPRLEGVAWKVRRLQPFPRGLHGHRQPGDDRACRGHADGLPGARGHGAGARTPGGTRVHDHLERRGRHARHAPRRRSAHAARECGGALIGPTPAVTRRDRNHDRAAGVIGHPRPP